MLTFLLRRLAVFAVLILAGSSLAYAQLNPGDLVVADPTVKVLVRVDPTTGARTTLSDFTDPTQGPIGMAPLRVAVEAAGTALVVDPTAGSGGQGALFRVDPITGFRTVVSDFGHAAQGPTGLDPVGVAVEPAGTILVTDLDAGSVSVDPSWVWVASPYADQVSRINKTSDAVTTFAVDHSLWAVAADADFV